MLRADQLALHPASGKREPIEPTLPTATHLDQRTPLLYPHFQRIAVANHPKSPAKNPTGDFGQFTNFMRKLVSVPHDEIKARLDAEKQARKRKRASSRASRETD